MLLSPILLSLILVSGIGSGHFELASESIQNITDGTDKPLVVSGNANINVKLSGRIHRMLHFVQDGKDSTLFYTDSDQGPTSLRVDATTHPSKNLTIGGTIELGIQQNRPLRVSQDSQDVGIDITGRLAEIYADSSKYGKLTLGRGFMASWVTPEIDLSGTQNGSLLTVGMLFGGLKFVEKETNKLSDIRVHNVFVDIERLLIMDRIRYDSPFFSGFRTSGGVASDGRWDLALRSRHSAGDFSLRGAVTYQDEPFLDIDWRWDAGISARHEPTGLNLTVGFSREGFNGGREGHGIIFKPGWLADLFTFGKTAISLDVFHNSNISTEGETGDSIGMFVVQNWDKYGMRFYAGYRRLNIDNPDVKTKSLNVLSFGVLLQF